MIRLDSAIKKGRLCFCLVMLDSMSRWEILPRAMDRLEKEREISGKILLRSGLLRQSSAEQKEVTERRSSLRIRKLKLSEIELWGGDESGQHGQEMRETSIPGE